MAAVREQEQLHGDEDEFEDEYEDEDEELEIDEDDLSAGSDDPEARQAGEAGGSGAADEAEEEGSGADEVEEIEEAGQQEEEEDDDDEEEEEEEAAQEWLGLRLMPEREAITDLLLSLKDQGRKQLTVLLLGKSGVGKSSTVNSLLGERAAPVSAFKLQPDTETSTIITRQVTLGDPELDGFKLRLIDTCGVEDPEAGDTVNYPALARIAEDIKGMPIDVVLYVDRLDLYRVEPLDKRIIQSLSDQFGPGIWKKTMLVLTHGNLTQPPPGTTFESFADRRTGLLRRAVRRAFFKPSLPAALVENSETCKVDAQRRRVLPDGSQWVVDLVGHMTDVALKGKPYSWRKGLTRKANNRLKWLIPVIAYAEYLAFKHLLQPILLKDEKACEVEDEEVWKEKVKERKRLGIGEPLKPSPENAWRLEQMYDDD